MVDDTEAGARAVVRLMDEQVTVEQMRDALRSWPREEREFVAKLTEREARLIGEAAVRVGLHPLPQERPSARRGRS